LNKWLNIKVVNWLLTRRCNLKCFYCGIINNKVKERSWIDVIRDIDDLHEASQPFHIFYGGEPLLFNGLNHIINHCNKHDVPYTIITNNSEGVQNRLQKLFQRTDYIQGLTSSVDPLIFDDQFKKNGGDRYTKSLMGYNRLVQLSKNNQIKDLVAEITVDSYNIKYLLTLVRELSDNNITSSITFIDLKKSHYYDFSNVGLNQRELLVEKSDELKQILQTILDEKLQVHMGEMLLNKVFDILPDNYDCKFEDCLHNITVDADGSLRLCLRINGREVKICNVFQLVRFSNVIRHKYEKDKNELCQGCNWTCPMMSDLAIQKDMMNSLIHVDKRSN